MLSGSIRVTNRCNLNCCHCYAFQKEGAELGTDEITSAIDAFSHLGAFRMFLTGGEPFIRDDLLSIVNQTHTKLKLYISTNGTLLTSDIIEKLSQTKVGSLQFSIDGIGETHDSIRGTQGAFETIMTTLKEAVAAVKNVGISMVLTKYNKDDVLHVLDLAESLKCTFFQLTFLHFSGKATKELHIPLKEKIKVIEQLREMNETLNVDVSVAAPPPFAMTDENAFLCTFPYILGVNANGDVAPCDGLLHVKDMVIGTLKKMPLEDIWEKSELLNQIRSITPEKLKGICRKCTVKDFCAGGCRAASFLTYGDFTGPDPLCQKAYDKGLFPSHYIGGR